MIHQASQSSYRDEEKLHTEWIVIWIICCFEFDKQEIDGGIGTCQVDNFHHSIVHRDEGEKEVKVAGAEHKRKEHLTFSG